MTFYSLGWIPKFFVPLKMFCPLYILRGLWRSISHNNGNKPSFTLHFAVALCLSVCMHTVQIINESSCAGEQGEKVSKDNCSPIFEEI